MPVAGARAWKGAGAHGELGLASSPRLQGPRARPVSRVMSPAIRSARVRTECGTRLASGPLKYPAQQWAPPSFATSAPAAARVNGARRQVIPVQRLGICIIYARGRPPSPLPHPECARNYRRPIGGVARPRESARAKLARPEEGHRGCKQGCKRRYATDFSGHGAGKVSGTLEKRKFSYFCYLKNLGVTVRGRGAE